MRRLLCLSCVSHLTTWFCPHYIIKHQLCTFINTDIKQHVAAAGRQPRWRRWLWDCHSSSSLWLLRITQGEPRSTAAWLKRRRTLRKASDLYYILLHVSGAEWRRHKIIFDVTRNYTVTHKKFSSISLLWSCLGRWNNLRTPSRPHIMHSFQFRKYRGDTELWWEKLNDSFWV